MRNKINTRGIAPVLSTVLIISLAVAALAILSPIILKAIKGPMLSPAVSCSDMTNFHPVTIEELCYDAGGELRVKLKRTFEAVDVPSLAFSLENNGKTRKWECSSDCNNCEILSQGETKFYYLTVGETSGSASITLFAGECVLERKEAAGQCSG